MPFMLYTILIQNGILIVQKKTTMHPFQVSTLWIQQKN